MVEKLWALENHRKLKSPNLVKKTSNPSIFQKNIYTNKTSIYFSILETSRCAKRFFHLKLVFHLRELKKRRVGEILSADLINLSGARGVPVGVAGRHTCNPNTPASRSISVALLGSKHARDSNSFEPRLGLLTSYSMGTAVAAAARASPRGSARLYFHSFAIHPLKLDFVFVTRAKSDELK